MRALLFLGVTAGVLCSPLAATGDAAGKAARRYDLATALSYCRLAHTYYRARQYDKALEQLQNASVYDADNPSILYATGVVLFALQRYDEASSHFQSVSRHRATPQTLREKAENGLIIVDRLKARRHKRRMGKLVSWSLIALVAATIPLIIRTFTRFFSLAAIKRKKRHPVKAVK